MSMTKTENPCACGLMSPTRNRYFHGKLLDVYHFELETTYHRYKRRLLNRLVTGPGVVCGLDVNFDGDDEIVVTAGVAIDLHGNEIIVPSESPPMRVPLKPEPAGDGGDDDGCGTEDDDYVHLVVCYHECEVEPVPVMTSACGDKQACEPGIIKEKYCLEIRPGCAEPPPRELAIPDCISSGKLDYDMLAKIITQECPECVEDPCIPLANIFVGHKDDEHSCSDDRIDITVRPIVFTNDLLFQLLMCGVTETKYRRPK